MLSEQPSNQPPVGADVFGSLDREVWAVTSGTLETPAALLATWVMQATLDPDRPVLLAGIAPNHHTAQRIDATGQLAAHLLRADQAELGLRLATASGRDTDKLQGRALHEAADELPVPVLKDCHGWVAGPVFARLDAGDRIFYWVDLVASRHVGGPGPLRQSQLIAAASPATLELLKADRSQDIARHRPLHQQWRDHLPESLRIR